MSESKVIKFDFRGGQRKSNAGKKQGGGQVIDPWELERAQFARQIAREAEAQWRGEDWVEVRKVWEARQRRVGPPRETQPGAASDLRSDSSPADHKPE